jgi:hypothetical protein
MWVLSAMIPHRRNGLTQNCSQTSCLRTKQKIRKMDLQHQIEKDFGEFKLAPARHPLLTF